MPQESKPTGTGEQTPEQTKVGQDSQALSDDEIAGVTGGTASSQVIKTLGEALAAVARKQ